METAIQTGTTELLSQLALLVITIITGLIARPVLQTLKTRLSANQFQFLQDVATAAVQSAEQNGLTGAITDKRDYAYGRIVDILAKQGINVDPEDIDDAIEAAVLREFNITRVYANNYLDDDESDTDPQAAS